MTGTPRPQHANGGLNVIPEDMAAVGANGVAEQQPPPGYHEVEDHPNMYVRTPAMQQRIPEDRQGYPPSVKRFAAGTDLALSHNSPMGMQDLGGRIQRFGWFSLRKLTIHRTICHRAHCHIVRCILS